MAQELVLVPKEKYLKLTQVEDQTSRREETPPTPTKELPSDADSSTRTRIFDILEHIIPIKFQTKAKGLLKFLSQYGGDVVSWNEKGNLIYKGDIIEGSHIGDLLKHALTNNPRRNPTGYRQFFQALKDIHTPTSFIHNKEMMKRSEEQSGHGFVVQRQTDGAPPNYQPPKKKKATKIHIKWLKF